MIIASNIYCFSKYIVEEPNYPYCLFDNAFLVRYNRDPTHIYCPVCGHSLPVSKKKGGKKHLW